MQINGRAMLDRRTKNLVTRLKRNDIAIIHHDDIDEVAAGSIIDCRPQLVINADASVTGKYPARGAYRILKAGIPILDNVGEEIFSQISEGEYIRVVDDQVYIQNKKICTGRWLNVDVIEQILADSAPLFYQELERFIDNTLKYASEEKQLLIGTTEIPALNCRIEGRQALIVVRGSHYKRDLRAIKAYIKEKKPVLIGVDGGADALLECGWKPDIIVGDMDSVSDRALKSCRDIVVHAYPDGTAPGKNRTEKLNLEAKIMPMAGTSEDVAMVLAWEAGASLIVAVGAHSNIVDFLEKQRKGMASTLLVRIKVGARLVDAKGVSQLYRQSVPAKYLVQMIIAALIPICIILWVSPVTQPFIRILVLKVKMLFGMS